MQDESENEKQEKNGEKTEKRRKIEMLRGWVLRGEVGQHTDAREQQQRGDREQMNWFKADRVQAVFAVTSHSSAQCQLQPASPVTASALARANVNTAAEPRGRLTR